VLTSAPWTAPPSVVERFFDVNHPMGTSMPQRLARRSHSIKKPAEVSGPRFRPVYVPAVPKA